MSKNLAKVLLFIKICKFYVNKLTKIIKIYILPSKMPKNLPMSSPRWHKKTHPKMRLLLLVYQYCPDEVAELTDTFLA